MKIHSFRSNIAEERDISNLKIPCATIRSHAQRYLSLFPQNDDGERMRHYQTKYVEPLECR